ncbi:PTS sugar transporter subunit IIC [Erysipelotrichaceae bacterium]|nr:PTS sugar transporter subunit IIC [Erysipelotrichaceae bacterium]
MDSRSRKLIVTLQLYGNSPLEKLEQILGMSRRQIRYSIEKINELLASNDIAVEIYIKGADVEISNYTDFIEQVDIAKLEQAFYFTKEERLYMLIIYLYCNTGFISQQHLQHFLKVSRNSIQNDLIQTQEILQKYQVEISYNRKNGYRITGDQWHKRGVLLLATGMLQQLTEAERIFEYLRIEMGYMQPYENYRKQMGIILEKSRRVYVESKLEGILSQLYFIWGMKSTEITMNMQQRLLGKNGKEHEHIISYLENLFVKRTTGLQEYTEILLQSAMLYGDSTIFDAAFSTSLHAFIEEMLKRFELMTGLVLENRKQFIKGLYGHLRALYYRIFYKIPCLNSSATEIQLQYRELFAIIGILLKPLAENLGEQIMVDEIAYITLHFAAGYQKTEDISNKMQTHALIYCANGIGTSAILTKQLEALFPEIIFERGYQKQLIYSEGHQYKLIFATSEIQHPTVPTFIVPTLLTFEKKRILVDAVQQVLAGVEQTKKRQMTLIELIKKSADILDEESLRKDLQNFFKEQSFGINERGKQPMLAELITADMVQFVDEVSNWEEAIKIGAQPLLESGAIRSEYVQAMIENVKKHGPYILVGNQIAIPHARPEEGVEAIGISCLILKNPVAILDNPEKKAKIFFTLAAIDGQAHLRALGKLSEILLDEQRCAALLAVQNPEEFLEIIQK